MTDMTSVRLSLPFLAAGQAQKEISHNEALQLLDLLVQPVALSADLSTPPASPAEGECWIVGPSPDGLWAGQTGCITQWTAAGWRFAAPATGWRCHVADRGAVMIHDGSAWLDDAVRSDGYYVAGQRIISARQATIADPSGGAIVDAVARGSISEILTALRNHGLIEA